MAVIFYIENIFHILHYSMQRDIIILIFELHELKYLRIFAAFGID